MIHIAFRVHKNPYHTCHIVSLKANKHEIAVYIYSERSSTSSTTSYYWEVNVYSLRKLDTLYRRDVTRRFNTYAEAHKWIESEGHL